MVRWCWVNFQCRGVLLIWVIVWQGPTALAVGAGGGCFDIFQMFLLYTFSPLSPSFWETARYRHKFCLKGLLSPNQPTDQPTSSYRDAPSTSYCLFLRKLGFLHKVLYFDVDLLFYVHGKHLRSCRDGQLT